MITTFDAVDREARRTKVIPLWLGTWPLVEEIARLEKYPTLLSINREDLQNKLQEMIWRTKAVEGSDVSGAGVIVEIENEYLLVKLAKEFFDEFKLLGEQIVVLGCTELPLLVGKYMKGYDFGGIKLLDPADLIAEMIEVDE